MSENLVDNYKNLIPFAFSGYSIVGVRNLRGYNSTDNVLTIYENQIVIGFYNNAGSTDKINVTNSSDYDIVVFSICLEATSSAGGLSYEIPAGQNSYTNISPINSSDILVIIGLKAYS